MRRYDVVAWLAEPKVRGRQSGPPSPLRGFGAASMRDSLGLPSRSSPKGERRMVDQTGASWNQLAIWLQQVGELQRAAVS